LSQVRIRDCFTRANFRSSFPYISNTRALADSPNPFLNPGLRFAASGLRLRSENVRSERYETFVRRASSFENLGGEWGLGSIIQS